LIMFFSITSLSYIFLALGLGLLSFRLYQYWRQSRNTTSRLLFLFSLPLFAFALVRTFTGTFFLDNAKILIDSMFLVLFFEGLAAAIAGYLVSYLKFSSKYAWVGFATFFILTLATIILGFYANYNVQVGRWGSTDWGFPGGLIGNIYAAMRTAILLFPFASLIIIMMQQAKESQNPTIKKRSLGLSLVLFMGIFTGVIDFIFSSLLGIGSIYRDISVMITGLALLIIVLATQKSPSKEAEI
jgi:hypothetical protein